MCRRSLARLRSLSWGERGLLVEAGLCLALAQLGVWLVPFKRMAPWVGTLMSAAPAMELEPAQACRAERLGWAVRVMATLTPWDSRCLAQALAVKAMLNRRHLPGALMLGVAKAPHAAAKLEAHAWVRCGPQLLTGGAGHERFIILAIFV